MLKIERHYNKFTVRSSDRGFKVFASNIAEIKACVEHHFGSPVHAFSGNDGPNCPLCRKIEEETAKRNKAKKG